MAWTYCYKCSSENSKPTAREFFEGKTSCSVCGEADVRSVCCTKEEYILELIERIELLELKMNNR